MTVTILVIVGQASATSVANGVQAFHVHPCLCVPGHSFVRVFHGEPSSSMTILMFLIRDR